MNLNGALTSLCFSLDLFQIANMFAVTVLLAVSFGSIGYVGARPQATLPSSRRQANTAPGDITCATIKAELDAQQPIILPNSRCTKSIRAVSLCNISIQAHDCRQGCIPTSGVTISFKNCFKTNISCPYITGCGEYSG